MTNVSIGTLYHDPRRSAFVVVDELLAKNFAVLGATGSGKSCAVTLLLSAILADHRNAHIILLDPHNEYGRAFGELAEVVNVDNLQLPFWLLDFEEAVGVLVRGGTAQEQEAQAIILKDAITRARRRFATENGLDDAIENSNEGSFGIPQDVSGALSNILGRLGDVLLAVRSSSLNEDLSTSSFAGQYETVLRTSAPHRSRSIHQCRSRPPIFSS